ncbi:uncharacterized protein LOC141632281 [Silene latifolia]|uniref:uncharacterized protein LOC141632281 n=1 Tax=Silene latifolia TaxID=37657 RepID=UPI003D77CB3E
MSRVIQIPSTKDPGPDGYSSAFYKDSWSVIGEDLCTVMMVALRFPPHFTQLIMECVSTASYSLVLNGEPFRLFQGKKGLRHGGDKQSVMVLLRSFATFSAASELHMNKQKSNIYFNGVQGTIKEQIIRLPGCVEGQIPFKYLGVPVTAGKLGKKDCQVLIKKIIEKIWSIGARKISYASRLIMVQLVLTSMFNYWANIFLIPKGVLKKIDSICRNYLWDGTSIYVRTPLVSWEHVCTPKTEGGLGIRYILDWNIATIGKLVWWIFGKLNSLWVKEMDMTMAVWLADQKGYSVSSGYEWIRNKEQKVGWVKLVWNNRALPKHRFMAWLIFRNSLNLKDRLFRFGVCSDDKCCVCNAGKETVRHLFQQCRYSRLILQGVCSWLHINVPTDNGIIWIGRRNCAPIQMSVCIAALMAVYYNVWHQQNLARLEGVLLSPRVLVAQIKSLIRSRIQQLRLDTVSASDRAWISLVIVNPI